LQKHNQYRHAGRRSPEGKGWHLLSILTTGDPASGAGWRPFWTTIYHQIQSSLSNSR